MSIRDVDLDPADAGPWAEVDARALALADALERADAVAGTLAADVAERDARGAAPHEEVALLRASGLLALMAPVAAGGAGAAWSTAFRVSRRIAEVDPSIAQLLGYHWLNEATLGFVLPEGERDLWYRRSVEGGWFWADSVNPTDPDLELRPGQGADHVWLLDGLKRFASGAEAADVILASARVRDESGALRDSPPLFVVVRQGAPGIEHGGDWDNLGQRMSASGSVRYRAVPIDPQDVIGQNPYTPFALLQAPGIQLSFANLYLGLATGALERGRELVLARRGAWPMSNVDSYRDDPFVQRLFGELEARLEAGIALADRAGRAYDQAAALGHGLSAEQRQEIEIEAARVKIVATEAALDIAHRLYEATGASSTMRAVGFDRYWRDIRTHSLHDPVDYKKLEVGRWFLTGEGLPPSLYT